jgi:hypothetical protein
MKYLCVPLHFFELRREKTIQKENLAHRDDIKFFMALREFAQYDSDF